MTERCCDARENTFTLWTRGGLTPRKAPVHTAHQLLASICCSCSCLRAARGGGTDTLIRAAVTRSSSLKCSLDPRRTTTSAFRPDSLPDDIFPLSLNSSSFQFANVILSNGWSRVTTWHHVLMPVEVNRGCFFFFFYQTANNITE